MPKKASFIFNMKQHLFGIGGVTSEMKWGLFIVSQGLSNSNKCTAGRNYDPVKNLETSSDHTDVIVSYLKPTLVRPSHASPSLSNELQIHSNKRKVPPEGACLRAKVPAVRMSFMARLFLRGTESN